MSLEVAQIRRRVQSRLADLKRTAAARRERVAAAEHAYAAFLSTGVGFTLQVVGQRDAPASHAALIMALEAVFAAIGGALVLGERMDVRAMLGAALMLGAVIVAQLGVLWSSRTPLEPLPHVPEP